MSRLPESLPHGVLCISGLSVLESLIRQEIYGVGPIGMFTELVRGDYVVPEDTELFIIDGRATLRSIRATNTPDGPKRARIPRDTVAKFLDAINGNIRTHWEVDDDDTLMSVVKNGSSSDVADEKEE